MILIKWLILFSKNFHNIHRFKTLNYATLLAYVTTSVQSDLSLCRVTAEPG